MEFKYTITLADGRQLAGLGLNGNNYISKTRIDESIFEGNLSTLTITGGDEEIVMHDCELVQQVEWTDGNYWLVFRELSEAEKLALVNERTEAQAIYTAMMTDTLI